MGDCINVILQERKFYTAREIAEIMEISISQAYRIIKLLNNELKEQGKITISGKVSRRYFDEKSGI